MASSSTADTALRPNCYDRCSREDDLNGREARMSIRLTRHEFVRQGLHTPAPKCCRRLGLVAQKHSSQSAWLFWSSLRASVGLMSHERQHDPMEGGERREERLHHTGTSCAWQH
jgi:hypothetical protein